MLLNPDAKTPIWRTFCFSCPLCDQSLLVTAHYGCAITCFHIFFSKSWVTTSASIIVPQIFLLLRFSCLCGLHRYPLAGACVIPHRTDCLHGLGYLSITEVIPTPTPWTRHIRITDVKNRGGDSMFHQLGYWARLNSSPKALLKYRQKKTKILVVKFVFWYFFLVKSKKRFVSNKLF